MVVAYLFPAKDLLPLEDVSAYEADSSSITLNT